MKTSQGSRKARIMAFLRAIAVALENHHPDDLLSARDLLVAEIEAGANEYREQGIRDAVRRSGIPQSERELIQRAIKQVKHTEAIPTPRWELVKRLFCCGSTVATAICTNYGFDPDYLVDPIHLEIDE